MTSVQSSLVFNNDITYGNLNVTVVAFVPNQPVSGFTHGPSGTNNVTLTPNGVKWSLLISGYPYQLANSYLALTVGVYQRDSDVTYASSNASVLALGGTNGGVLAWNSSVAADGKLQSVYSSSLYANATLNAEAQVSNAVPPFGG